MEFYRNTYLKVNLDNLYHNIKNIKYHYCPEQALIAVVKANGYGLNASEVGMVAIEAGASVLAVSSLDEALKLRQDIQMTKILVMGLINPEHGQVAADNQITITIDSLETAQYLAKNIFDAPLQVHIKVNTGMNRIGASDVETIRAIIETLQTNDNIEVDGIFTHFSSADSNEEYFMMQLTKFKAILAQLNQEFNYVHCSNTPSLFYYRHLLDFCSAFRIGLGLYGSFDDRDKVLFDLKYTFELVSHINAIKKVEKGSVVGYSTNNIVDEDCFIATIPIGYADGLLRANKDSFVEINGNMYQLFGNICMDQCMIKVDQMFELNTPVTIIGGQEYNNINYKAKQLNTIEYEIMTSMSYRLARHYYMNDELSHVLNYVVDTEL